MKPRLLAPVFRILHVVRLAAVVREEIGQMGRQDDAVTVEQIEQLRERAIDDDVRIEINHPLAAAFAEKRLDRVGLTAVFNSRQRVLEGEFRPAIDPQLFRRDHLESLGRRLETVVDPVA